MRKVIWCGTALVVFGVVAAFFAVNYAVENPNSFLGRSSRLVYNLGVRCNPMTRWSKELVKDFGPVAVGQRIPGAELPIPLPELPGEENQEPPLAEQPDNAAVAEPIVVDAPEEADAPIQAEEPVPAPIPAGNEFIPLRESQDLEKLPIIMPYADDDEETEAMGSPTDDDAFMHLMMSWFFLTGNACPKECSGSYTICDQSLVQALLDCFKDLLAKEQPAGTDAEAAEMRPEIDQPMKDEEPQESEPARTPGTPTFQEDPYYHHQYPGCPYTGQCPYPYRYQAPMMKPVEPPPKKSMPESRQPSSQESRLVNNSMSIPGAPQWTPFNENPIRNRENATEWARRTATSINDPEGVVHPEVDTMECRPTDVPDEVTDDGPI